MTNSPEIIIYTRELEDGSIITLECKVYYRRKKRA